MKSPKTLIALVAALFLGATFAFAADAKKEEAKAAACCAAAAKDHKACAHPCCVEAAKAGMNCTKCGGSGALAKKEEAKK